MGQRWLDGYSAEVEIYLLVNGKRFDVAQIGNGSLILRDPAPIPASTEAKLVIKIDGHEEIEHVLLTESADESEKLIPFF
jgi:hypothetical protein